MHLFRLFVLAVCLFSVSTEVFARSILEKKMFYVTEQKKTDQARFWTVYLGQVECTLNRKFPGEGEIQVDASMNVMLISSGYVEGTGYSPKKGKVSSLPLLFIKTDTQERRIELDSIDYIFDRGTSVVMLNGETGDLLIDIEGQKMMARKFVLREFKLESYYGEEILRPGAEESDLIALSFSKEGAQRALKAPLSE